MNQHLVILRGAPASGKSTIAKKLRNFQKRIVWLKVDAFKDFFSETGDPGWENANEAALATLEYLLKEKFTVVMDGIFQKTEYIEHAVAIAQLKNISSSVYELNCSLETLYRRDTERPGIREGCRKPLGKDVIKRLYSIVRNSPYPGAIKLDTESNSIDGCILKINQ